MKAFVCACALALGFAGTAEAGSWRTCNGDKTKWAKNAVGVTINRDSFGPSLQPAVKDAIWRANRHASKFYMRFDRTSGGRIGHSDGINEIYAKNMGSLGVATTRASCYWLFGTRTNIEEVDVALGVRTTGRSWTFGEDRRGQDPFGGKALPAKTTLIHEFGHFLGTLHEARTYNVMGQSRTHQHVHSWWSSPYFGEDAGRTARSLYGTMRAFNEDVAVSPFHRTGASGAYSVHGFGGVRDAGAPAPQPRFENGLPVYTITPGASALATFTFENNGKSSQRGVPGELYVSTNAYISTYDEPVGSIFFSTLSPDTPATRTMRFTVPGGLEPGRVYYLGVRLDSRNVIRESDEGNNAALIAFRVRG